jgi:hypothetical protein
MAGIVKAWEHAIKFQISNFTVCMANSERRKERGEKKERRGEPNSLGLAQTAGFQFLIFYI